MPHDLFFAVSYQLPEQAEAMMKLIALIAPSLTVTSSVHTHPAAGGRMIDVTRVRVEGLTQEKFDVLEKANRIVSELVGKMNDRYAATL